MNEKRIPMCFNEVQVRPSTESEIEAKTRPTCPCVGQTSLRIDERSSLDDTSGK